MAKDTEKNGSSSTTAPLPKPKNTSHNWARIVEHSTPSLEELFIAYSERPTESVSTGA